MRGVVRISTLGLLFLLLWSSACYDVVQQDISAATIVIESPPDSLVTSSQDIFFLWSPVQGASLYEIQVVSPSFDAITAFPIDTVLAATKFGGTFPVGQYQWRIRALNNAYKSPFISRSFEIQ